MQSLPVWICTLRAARKRSFALVALAWLAFVAPAHAETESAAPAHSSSIEVEQVEDGLIRFKLPPGSKLPNPLKVELYAIKPLGKLKQADGGLPWFLFSARPCRECMQETALYMVRPGHPKPQMFVYPGKILDSKTRALLLESRAFFGKCLTRRPGDVYVVFQKERVDRRKNLQSSVFVAEPGPEGLDEQLLERHFPSFKDTLHFVKAKRCQEIDGRYRVMVKKPLDIRARNLKDEDDEDDDENEDSPTTGGPASKGARPEDAETEAPAIPANGARPVTPR